MFHIIIKKEKLRNDVTRLRKELEMKGVGEEFLEIWSFSSR